MISILHPSRSRPQQAKDTFEHWTKNLSGKHEWEYIMSVDISDPKIEEYKLLSNQMPDTKWAIADNHNLVEAANVAASHAKGDILILISDDFSCFKNWDHFLINALKDKRDFVLKTNDGLQSWIVTLPIMDRAYYESQGYFYNPSFKHLFCDTYMTHKAELQGKLIIRKDLVFRHRHYTTGLTQKDEVNIKADSTWAQGEQTYLNFCRNNFDLGENINIFNLCLSAQPHIKWLKSKL